MLLHLVNSFSQELRTFSPKRPTIIVSCSRLPNTSADVPRTRFLTGSTTFILIVAASSKSFKFVDGVFFQMFGFQFPSSNPFLLNGDLVLITPVDGGFLNHKSESPNNKHRCHRRHA